LSDSGGDIPPGFLLARGQPIGRACFSATENPAVFVFKDKGGLGSTAIDTEKDH
jgi:hypothetical protein